MKTPIELPDSCDIMILNGQPTRTNFLVRLAGLCFPIKRGAARNVSDRKSAPRSSHLTGCPPAYYMEVHSSERTGNRASRFGRNRLVLSIVLSVLQDPELRNPEQIVPFSTQQTPLAAASGVCCVLVTPKYLLNLSRISSLS